MAAAKSSSEKRGRVAAILVLTLLPLPAVWLGLYRIHSLLWTFFLYHGACLLPAIIWQRRRWMDSLRLPTRNQALGLAAAIAVCLPSAFLAYSHFGAAFINPHALIGSLNSRGFRPSWFPAQGAYFVVVNATLEELFWRGVVLNELAAWRSRRRSVGSVWTAFSFAAWHYLALRLLLRPGWAAGVICLLFGAGLFFAWVYRRTGSLVLTILWHGLVFDLPLILILRLVLRGG